MLNPASALVLLSSISATTVGKLPPVKAPSSDLRVETRQALELGGHALHPSAHAGPLLAFCGLSRGCSVTLAGTVPVTVHGVGC